MELQMLLRAAEREDPSLANANNPGYTHLDQSTLKVLDHGRREGQGYQGSGELSQDTAMVKSPHRTWGCECSQCLKAMVSTHSQGMETLGERAF